MSPAERAALFGRVNAMIAQGTTRAAVAEACGIGLGMVDRAIKALRAPAERMKRDTAVADATITALLADGATTAQVSDLLQVTRPEIDRVTRMNAARQTVIDLFAAGAPRLAIARKLSMRRSEIMQILRLHDPIATIKGELAAGQNPADMVRNYSFAWTDVKAAQEDMPAAPRRVILRAVGPRAVACSTDDTPEDRRAAERTLRAMLGADAQWVEVAA